MILVGDGNELILLVRKSPRRKRLTLCCIGRKRHYRKDGSCRHTEAIIRSLIKPKYRALIDVEPFGGKAAGMNP